MLLRRGKKSIGFDFGFKDNLLTAPTEENDGERHGGLLQQPAES